METLLIILIVLGILALIPHAATPLLVVMALALAAAVILVGTAVLLVAIVVMPIILAIALICDGARWLAWTLRCMRYRRIGLANLPPEPRSLFIKLMEIGR